MWLNSVSNAISEVEYQHPGLAKKIAELDPSVEWTPEQYRDYSVVAAAIVEPFAFPGGESEDEDWYYSHCEDKGFGQVKANLDSACGDPESWRKICDLIDAQGY